jgi:hypothetical protein
MQTNHITLEQADEAAETLAQYIAQEESGTALLDEAAQDDGSLYAAGKSVFWCAGTDEIELAGTFTLQELLAIATHVQDCEDEINATIACADSCGCSCK